MQVDALREALRKFEDRAAGTFTMPRTAVKPEWAAVRSLLQQGIAANTLAIGGIGSFPPDHVVSEVVYGGAAALFEWDEDSGEQASLAVRASFYLDAAGDPQLRIEAVPTPGWKLAESLAGLEGKVVAEVVWADAAFLLSSEPTSDVRYPEPVPAGVSLSGTVAVEGPFANAGSLLASPDARTVAGPVRLAAGAMPTLALSPSLSAPGELAGLGLGLGAELRSFYRASSLVGGESWPVAEVAVLAYARLGESPVRLRMPLSVSGAALPMSLDGGPVELAGLAELDAIADGAKLDLVPAEAPAPRGWTLEELSIPLDLGDGSRAPAVAAVDLDVGTGALAWPILPAGILTLERLGLRVRVAFEDGAAWVPAAMLYGSVSLLGVARLQASVSIPSLYVSVSLGEGETVGLAELLGEFAQRLTGRAYRPPLGSMSVAAFDLVASPRSGEYRVSGRIDTGWSVSLGEGLVTVGLTSIEAEVGYDGSALAVALAASAQVGGAALWFGASTEGGDAGWKLGGGLEEGDRIEVAKLVRAFLAPSWDGDEYGAASLDVTELDLGLGLDPAGTPSEFSVLGAVAAGWSFELFGEGSHRLELAAAVDLEGGRPTGAGGLVEAGAAWELAGKVSGRASLFGLLLGASYEFDPKNGALSFEVRWGERALVATIARQTVGKQTRTLLTVRFGDLSLGELLDYLIGLAVPGQTRRLPPPWDVLYQVDFRNLTLTVDLDSYDVGVDYDLRFDLGFARVDRIGLLYTTAGGEGQVLLRLSGRFLGQEYGGKAGEPLEWDVVGGSAPAVPGRGGELVDVRYVALGQRLALPGPAGGRRTVGETIEAMREAFRPVSSGGAPLAEQGAAAMRYDAGAGWLFGVDATVLETVKLAAVFDDPYLYGAVVELEGERAGSLAGLRFELVYRRVAPDLGELSVDLRVPEAFRKWDFGEFSLTLGLVHLDVYTDGEFRVDAGFPTDGDFERSFALEVFPFTGHGGIYLGLLGGATSERVPAAGNGSFDPVLEAGVGLAVGVGKELRKGALSATLSLEIFGIFEGVYAPFHPFDSSLPKDSYFWFQGTVGVVGKLYGAVDLAVVKASVAIVARAQATLTIEAHRPAEVALTLEMKARGSVTVMYVEVPFSCSLELDASFSLGSATPAPWSPGTPPARALRQQRNQARRRTAGAVAPALPPVTPRPWQPAALYGEGTPKTATLQFLPALTVAQPVGEEDNRIEVVLLLAAENAIEPGAGEGEAAARVAREHLHRPDESGNAAFAPIVETFLRWAALEGAGASGAGTVGAAALARIAESLHDPAFVAATFAYPNVEGLLEASLHLEIVNFPQGGAAPVTTSGTFFAMVPEIVATVSQSGRATQRDYMTASPASAGYAANLAAYFEQTTTDAMAEAARDPLAPRAAAERSPASEDEPSLAQLIFGESLALLTQAAMQAAVDLLAAYPVAYPASDGKSLRALAQGLSTAAGTVTPLAIAEANRKAPLTEFAFAVTGLSLQVSAGQTLAEIAAAAPQQVAAATETVPGPLSAAAVGAANAGRVGLLREGATLTVPSFSYTRLQGDSDEFLAAFFRVRNLGTGGIENADWWAQAIATLNPTPIRWSEPGTAIAIPAGLHDTEATVTYTIHGGDTLERVAATLAQALPGTAPSGAYAVPELSHPVASTDTFASLAADFPGLTEAALIAANAAADVLTPLAVAKLPGFGVETVAKQTLAQLAELLDLTLADLVGLVEGVGGLFEPTAADAPLVVRDVPGASVNALVEAVANGAPANTIAAQVSRLLLHGLRVPSPQDTGFTSLTPHEVREGAFHGQLYGIFEAAGLQFPWLAPATQPLTIALSTEAAWLTLRNATVGAGRVAAGEEEERISVTLEDTEPVKGWLPSTTLTLNATAEELKAVESCPRHFELPQTVHWQAAAPPALGAGDALGEPSLWPFTPSLLAEAGALAQPAPAFSLRARPLDPPPSGEGAEPAHWAWAVHAEISLHRVPAPPPPGSEGAGGWLEGAYVVDGADRAGRDVLYGLWTHLAREGKAESGTQLFLLRPPSAVGESPHGLASDAIAAHLLKTNLCTRTRPPTAASADPPRVTYVAGLDDPLGFVTFLWEASTVQGGGFFLHYGDGLPDYVFDSSGRTTLTLVCLLASQTGVAPGRGLLSFNTCAVVADTVDAAATQVYAVQIGGTPPQTRVSTVSPGSVGFALSRANPLSAPGEEPNAEQRTQLLYDLFGFASVAGGGFEASNAGLPVAPTEGTAATWGYRRVFDAAALALGSGRVPQRCAALPSPGRDPYAGVSAGATLSVALSARDAFGNRAAATDLPADLELPVRYTDPLIGAAEWPGVSLSYRVARPPGGAAPALSFSLSLQAGGCTPGPGVGTAAALRAASAFALRYERVLFQLGRPGVTLAASTTLDPASAEAPLPLSRARFAGFAAGAYVFCSQLARLVPLRHLTVAADTLASVAESFGVAPADLLEANAELDAGALFANPVVVPGFARVKQGETLDALALRTGVAATKLVEANGGATVAAGLSVAVASHEVAVDPAQTLAELAAKAGCTVADLATANAERAGLLAVGAPWLARGIWVAASGSTLAALVGDFAAQGIHATPAEIAVANAARPGVFAAAAPQLPLTALVDRLLVAEPTTLSTLVAAHFEDDEDFAARNGGLAGLLGQGEELHTAVATKAAPAGVRVREWAELTLGLSVAQLAAANAVADPDGPAIPALRPGVELLLPQLLDPARLTATPYAIAAGDSLGGIAAVCGTTAADLGDSIQDIAGVFVPGASIEVGGHGTVSAGAEDSLASLLSRFPADDRPTLAELVAAIAGEEGLLRGGASIVCPPPPVPTDSTTLDALAAALDAVDAVAIGRANAAIDGFLDPDKELSYRGASFAIGAHGTLTGLYRRATAGAADGFDAFLAAVAGQDLLQAKAKVLLPPPPTTAAVALPVEPAVETAISPLNAAIVLARPAAEVASAFGPDSEVATRTSPVAAATAGVPATYEAFVRALESAWGGQLRVVVGRPENGEQPGRGRLYAVRLQAPGAPTTAKAIRRVEVGGEPSFFALPPLCRELVSRSAPVRTYVSGAEEPLPPPAEQLNFGSVDVQVWATQALEAIDLVLSAPYAAAAYAVGSAAEPGPFDRLVAAKRALATRIATGLTGVLEGTGGDAGAARAALTQTLDASLTQGWRVATVAQLPSAVSASFAEGGRDAGGHRLAVEAVVPATALGETTTLADLATGFGVHVAAVAATIGATPNLLQEGTRLGTWTIGPHSTLAEGAAALKIGLAELATTYEATERLFRDGVAVTLVGAGESVLDGDTLESVAERLASTALDVAVANQGTTDVLVGTVHVGGESRTVTPATSAIAAMAAAFGLSVPVFAAAIATQAVLKPAATLRSVSVPPDVDVSGARIGLDASTGTVELMLTAADPAAWRRLPLALDLHPVGLECEIEPVPLTDGYESSDWLTFLSPFGGPPAEVDTAVGRLDVPLPLRAYPSPPRLVSQEAGPGLPLSTAAEAPGDPLTEACSWTYTAMFETEAAAQDTVWLRLGFNFSTTVPPVESVVDDDDPFAALAEMATNLPAVRADLEELLLSPAELATDAAARKRARSAVLALAALAEGVAGSWGPIEPAGATASSPGLEPQQQLTFRLEERTRRGPAGEALLEALVLRRADGTDSWSPGRETARSEPRLGYVDGEGRLRMLAAEPHAAAAELVFALPDGVAAFSRRTFAISYADLDAIGIQNARTALWLTRNDRLLPDAATDSAFIYRTPETHFGEICAPALESHVPIVFGSGTLAQLPTALTGLFRRLLGDDPAAAPVQLALTVRQGLRLVPPERPGEAGIEMLTPVAFRPSFAYDAGVPAKVVEAVQAASPIAAGSPAIVSLELKVFSALAPERLQPLVGLGRLDYSVVVAGESTGEGPGSSYP